ncbi:MAG: hypothetical protein JWL71_4574 [Acidobacteria bacterium]|nr:hypothetical protein [Acidobacteriota bacterium]
MIRTLLKLALVAVVANATWHLFNVYSPHYKLKDAVQYAAQYRADQSDDELRDKVLALAGQYDVPIEDKDLVVGHDQFQTTIDLSYVRTVEIVPGVTRRWPLSMHVQTLNSRSPVLDSPK